MKMPMPRKLTKFIKCSSKSIAAVCGGDAADRVQRRRTEERREAECGGTRGLRWERWIDGGLSWTKVDKSCFCARGRHDASWRGPEDNGVDV